MLSAALAGMGMSVLRILFLLVVAYAGLCLYVYLVQDNYVYIPDRRIETDPGSIGLTFDELRLVTSDGVRLHAWHVRAPKAAGITVLVCHGNAGTIADRMDHAAVLAGEGFDTLLFDYRGYGRSDGVPSEDGTYRDAEAAWQHLVANGVPASNIAVYGESLGGAVATWLALKHPPRALILDSTFTSASDMARRMFPFLPVSLFCRFRYDTHARIGGVRCPVVVGHAPEDEMIPFRMGRALYEAASPPKRFVELTGGHNDGTMMFDAARRGQWVPVVRSGGIE